MSVAERVRSRELRSKPGVLLSADDFEGSRSAVESALSRMASRGELPRVRRGLYFKGVRSRFGPGRPPIEDVVHKICGKKGVGPAGWNAARVLGLTTQVPARLEFAVVKAPPANLPGVIFRVRRNTDRLAANPREIAVFELLRTWPTHTEGSWADLVAKVAALRSARTIDLDRMARIASVEPSPALRGRMRTLIDELDPTCTTSASW